MAASCLNCIRVLRFQTNHNSVFLSKVFLKSCDSSTNCSLLRRLKHDVRGLSLVSTSLPDVDSEIETVSPHSQRGKAMRRLQQRLKIRERKETSGFREKKMDEDQDWSNVYPTQASFKWSAVPLPVRMGFPVNRGIPPHKYGNAELVKIPNFLHLTKPAVKKHCAAIKDLLTEWPEGLESDELCEKHFPLEVETSNYCFSGPSLRHPKARLVTVRVKLSALSLDKHSRWKLIQLVKDRYDKETDILTITTDRCPVRKQNYDYAMYLLSVLVHESWITEPWEESEITEEDREEFIWDLSHSRKNTVRLKACMENQSKTIDEIPEEKEAEILQAEDVEYFKNMVENYRNTSETLESITAYKTAALKLVGLQQNQGSQV